MIPGISRTTKRRDPVGSLADNNIGWVNPVMDRVEVARTWKNWLVPLAQGSANPPITSRLEPSQSHVECLGGSFGCALDDQHTPFESPSEGPRIPGASLGQGKDNRRTV